MKIKTTYKSCEEVTSIPCPEHQMPAHASLLFGTTARIISTPELWKARFKFTGALPKKQDAPYLILMNHSSFIDLKIA